MLAFFRFFFMPPHEPVRMIFDHFRNVGIAAVMLPAAVWLEKEATTATTLWSSVNFAVSSLVLFLLSIFLYFLNMLHGIERFDERFQGKFVLLRYLGMALYVNVGAAFFVALSVGLRK